MKSRPRGIAAGELGRAQYYLAGRGHHDLGCGKLMEFLLCCLFRLRRVSKTARLYPTGSPPPITSSFSNNPNAQIHNQETENHQCKAPRDQKTKRDSLG